MITEVLSCWSSWIKNANNFNHDGRLGCSIIIPKCGNIFLSRLADWGALELLTYTHFNTEIAQTMCRSRLSYY